MSTIIYIQRLLFKRDYISSWENICYADKSEGAVSAWNVANFCSALTKLIINLRAYYSKRINKKLKGTALYSTEISLQTTSPFFQREFLRNWQTWKSCKLKISLWTEYKYTEDIKRPYSDQKIPFSCWGKFSFFKSRT